MNEELRYRVRIRCCGTLVRFFSVVTSHGPIRAKALAIFIGESTTTSFGELLGIESGEELGMFGHLGAWVDQGGRVDRRGFGDRLDLPSSLCAPDLKRGAGSADEVVGGQ